MVYPVSHSNNLPRFRCWHLAVDGRRRVLAAAGIGTLWAEQVFKAGDAHLHLEAQPVGFGHMLDVQLLPAVLVGWGCRDGIFVCAA